MEWKQGPTDGWWHWGYNQSLRSLHLGLPQLHQICKWIFSWQLLWRLSSFLSFVRWIPKPAKLHLRLHASLKGRWCSGELWISSCTDTAPKVTQAQKDPTWLNMDPAWHSCKQQRQANKKALRKFQFEKLGGKGSCGIQRAVILFSLQVSWFLPQFCYSIVVWPRAGHLTLMKFINKYDSDISIAHLVMS